MRLGRAGVARGSGPAELVIGALERLAPNLMTALAIVGGLLASTWLNLLVVPSWYGRATH